MPRKVAKTALLLALGVVVLTSSVSAATFVRCMPERQVRQLTNVLMFGAASNVGAAPGTFFNSPAVPI